MAAASATTPRTPGSQKEALSPEMQVHYVHRLLSVKGEQSAFQIRQRIANGQGVTVKGLHFSPDVLAKALEKWNVARPNPDPDPEPPEERPPKTPSQPARSAVSALSPRSFAPAGAGSAAPMLPTARKRSFSTPADENIDPQVTPGRAAPRQPKRLRKAALDPAEAEACGKRRVEEDSEAPGGGAAGRTVKELKVLLSGSGLDFSDCVEKADLQALWDRYTSLKARPLEELRASCAAAGGPRQGSLEECARFLAQPRETMAAPAAAGGIPAQPAAEPISEEAAIRERDAEREVHRIQALRKERYPTAAAWGFAVLEVTVRDVAAVQRSYRTLMRKLHPDKVGRSDDVGRAVELIREAKEACERGLSKHEPPGAPKGLRSVPLCATPGSRKFRLQWTPPEERPSAPVRRYLVAAFDPAYGKALTITVLEPDYSEELHRFVGVEELTSYVFAERELQKMPRLWQQAVALVQVAAANEAGQSPWASLQLPLLGAVPAQADTVPKLKRGTRRLQGQQAF